MRTLFNLFSIVLATCLIYTQTFAWDLELDSEGIKVFTETTEQSSFKAFRGETYIEASLKDIVSNHLNVESMSDWLHDCEESQLLSRLSDHEFLVYQRTDAPWPVTDRDYVMKAHIEQDPETYVVTMEFEASADLNQHNDECVQVTQLKGYWRFTPQDDGKVFVEYETHADPAGQVPAWLANQFVVDQPFETLRNLKARVRYQENLDLLDIDFIMEPLR